ncbi:hypothetical protein [Rhizobium paknamense]|uniref:Uncharacterized protein n=1 Tax=Rhizobium paknamense TaxID=1206817 RepID=A0ABU0IAU0_9HYPH|nr:hypothetical protein [Rhizobium paknamense]MDQ0455338.1 hypothetical protein [Rhizobium paknamense]
MDDELTPEEARQDHWDMLRFLGGNALFGAALGLLVAGLLLWLDVGGLGTRLDHSDSGLIVGLMLGLPLALTFAAAVTASAVMLMPYQKKKAQRD